MDDITRPSCKNFLWASQKKFHTDTSNAEHLQRSSCKDLSRRIWTGSPQDLLARACTRWCKDLLARNSAGSHKMFSDGPEQDHARTCREGITSISTEPPKGFHRHAHGHVTRAFFCKNLRETLLSPEIGARSLCEPAQSKCAWTCHKSNCMQMFRKNVGSQMEHPDQAPALTLTVRISQCAHSVLGTFHAKGVPGAPWTVSLYYKLWDIYIYVGRI